MNKRFDFRKDKQINQFSDDYHSYIARLISMHTHTTPPSPSAEDIVCVGAALL